MSDNGAHQDDMRFFSRLSDRETDAILAGQAPAGDDELQELAAFFHDVRVSLVEPPPTAIAAAHLAAIAEAARAGDFPAAEAPATLRPRRRRLRNPLTLPARMAAAAAGLALLAAFGGAAYAGRLPDPVQDKVADLARNVGLSLPGNANDVDQGDVGNLDQGRQGNGDQGTQGNQGNQEQGTPGSSDAGAQGNVGQGVQNDKNEGAQSGNDDGAHANADDGAEGNADGAQTNADDVKGNEDSGAEGQAGADRTAPGNADAGAQGTAQAPGGQANADDGGARANPGEGAQGDASAGDGTDDGNAHQRNGGDG